MPFDWKEFLSLARELAIRSDEAALRTSISRSYYAALGAASTFLSAEGISLPADGTLHAAVWETFYDSADDRRYYIGIDGRWLRANRNAADYDPELTGLPLRAQQAIKKAESVLRALERVRKSE